MENFKNSTLLLVDDEPFLLEMLSARLKVFGAKILTAPDGLKALELFKSEKVDAVLTDIDMPHMSGIELLASIRALGSLTPVVILTGVGDQAATLTALRLGATDFLDKPFDSKVIEEVMSRALAIGIAARNTEATLEDQSGDKRLSLEEFRRWKEAMKPPGIELIEVDSPVKSPKKAGDKA